MQIHLLPPEIHGGRNCPLFSIFSSCSFLVESCCPSPRRPLYTTGTTRPTHPLASTHSQSLPERFVPCSRTRTSLRSPPWRITARRPSSSSQGMSGSAQPRPQHQHPLTRMPPPPPGRQPPAKVIWPQPRAFGTRFSARRTRRGQQPVASLGSGSGPAANPGPLRPSLRLRCWSRTHTSSLHGSAGVSVYCGVCVRVLQVMCVSGKKPVKYWSKGVMAITPYIGLTQALLSTTRLGLSQLFPSQDGHYRHYRCLPSRWQQQ